METKCIVAIVERGKADAIVEKAKKAGANGATILYGRGTGQSEALKLLNLHIEASKEIIIILSDIDKYKPIYDTIVEAGRLNVPGTGIIFTVSVSELTGLDHRNQK
ncbi:MAG TPA: P-II family nitrogen regulator [Caldisericia bacterium]|nr:P-II family nitrogen regulator [Caldisericia bacterium]HPB33468.1 P-II family nitrogen regulator [Caldisericia bacterium]HQL66264.1 P-II family nitrogen regulator [Caldisericia bacterium]HQN48982.1 P-II family nitrogen regulator [Caldisericia bacterium]HQP00191.1 P-II family nitrogen regulator [Caldisericia bacterium]